MPLNQQVGRTDSGKVVGLGMLATAIVVALLCQTLGWEPTWRTLGVTPLQPPFFDMHVINDYAACAWKGADAYAPHACNVDNYNYPPVWLWLGLLGIEGSDSGWLAAIGIVAAAVVTTLLFRQRAWSDGVIALLAILSPPVMMGIERGNLDLLILALVGSAALVYRETRVRHEAATIALLSLGIVLKLFPMFCVSLASRFSKRRFIFASILAALSLVYLGSILNYVFLIRQNVPTTFILSYGYKAIFLGIDHLRSEAEISPIRLDETWAPEAAVVFVLICASIVALQTFRRGSSFCEIDTSVAGTAFLFGAGIYCGTFLLGTNFIYRLMFLLLCIPQLQDWQLRRGQRGAPSDTAESCLFGSVLGVLWLNGSANGHSIFLLLPQCLGWFLFFLLATVTILNLLRTLRLRD